MRTLFILLLLVCSTAEAQFRSGTLNRDWGERPVIPVTDFGPASGTGAWPKCENDRGPGYQCELDCYVENDAQVCFDKDGASVPVTQGAAPTYESVPYYLAADPMQRRRGARINSDAAAPKLTTPSFLSNIWTASHTAVTVFSDGVTPTNATPFQHGAVNAAGLDMIKQATGSGCRWSYSGGAVSVVETTTGNAPQRRKVQSCIRNGTSYTVRVNGKSATTVSASEPVAPTVQEAWFGRYSGSGFYLNGTLERTRVYSGAVPDWKISELEALANGGYSYSGAGQLFPVTSTRASVAFMEDDETGEENLLPKSHQFESWATDSTGTTSADVALNSSGEMKADRFTGATTGNPHIYWNSIKGTGGALTFSVRLRASSGTATGVDVRLYDATAALNRCSTGSVTLTEAWQDLTCSGTAPSGNTVFPIVYMGASQVILLDRAQVNTGSVGRPYTKTEGTAIAFGRENLVPWTGNLEQWDLVSASYIGETDGPNGTTGFRFYSPSPGAQRVQELFTANGGPYTIGGWVRSVGDSRPTFRIYDFTASATQCSATLATNVPEWTYVSCTANTSTKGNSLGVLFYPHNGGVGEGYSDLAFPQLNTGSLPRAYTRTFSTAEPLGPQFFAIGDNAPRCTPGKGCTSTAASTNDATDSLNLSAQTAIGTPTVTANTHSGPFASYAGAAEADTISDDDTAAGEGFFINSGRTSGPFVQSRFVKAGTLADFTLFNWGSGITGNSGNCSFTGFDNPATATCTPSQGACSVLCADGQECSKGSGVPFEGGFLRAICQSVGTVTATAAVGCRFGVGAAAADVGTMIVSNSECTAVEGPPLVSPPTGKLTTSADNNTTPTTGWPLPGLEIELDYTPYSAPSGYRFLFDWRNATISRASVTLIGSSIQALTREVGTVESSTTTPGLTWVTGQRYRIKFVQRANGQVTLSRDGVIVANESGKYVATKIENNTVSIGHEAGYNQPDGSVDLIYVGPPR